MRKKTKGFTLIELMIVVAIIGILAAVAIPAFLEYMRSGKSSEVDLALNRIAKGSKAWHTKFNQYPSTVSVPPGMDDNWTPTASSCASAGKLYPAGAFSAAAADTKFAVIGFNVEDKFRFQYQSSDGVDSNEILFDGQADLDCDVATGGGVTTQRLRMFHDTQGIPAADFQPKQDTAD